MLDPRNLLEVLAFSDQERLYTDASGRRIVLDCEGQVEWGADRCDLADASIDDSCTVLACPDEKPVTVWALHGPRPKLGHGEPVAGRASGPGWLTDVKGLHELDGQCFAPLDLPNAPVLGDASFDSAIFHPDGRQTVPLLQLDPSDEESMAAVGGSVRTAGKPQILTSMWIDGTTASKPHMVHLGPISWDVRASGDLVVGKTYDRFHGLQRARVLVDGERIGVWSATPTNRVERWGVTRFGLPPGLPSQFRLTIDPLPGTPLWDVSEYTVWELRGRQVG